MIYKINRFHFSGFLLRALTGSYLASFMTSVGLALFAAGLLVVVIFLERYRKRTCDTTEEQKI